MLTNFEISLVIFFHITIHSAVHATVTDLYCGEQNCYDLLSVNRESSRNEISKAYRKHASKFHPDRFQTQKEKDEASKTFITITAAYDVLKDDESRNEYDYMLDHPEEMIQNYYRYYRRRVGPKVDARLVIIVTISLISALQYYTSSSNYETAINHFVSVPKYRMQAMEIAKEQNLLQTSNKSSTKKLSKVEQRKIEDDTIRNIVENKMKIGGAYAKPKITDILWIQILLLPYTVCKFMRFYIAWFVYYTLLRHEYDLSTKLYLIRRNMKMSEDQFASLEQDEIDEFLDLNLWMKDEFAVWKEERDEETKQKMLSSGKYKQYRRYMKKGGPDRMTFDDS